MDGPGVVGFGREIDRSVAVHLINPPPPPHGPPPKADLPYIGCEVCELVFENLWNQSQTLRAAHGDQVGG